MKKIIYVINCDSKGQLNKSRSRLYVWKNALLIHLSLLKLSKTFLSNFYFLFQNRIDIAGFWTKLLFLSSLLPLQLFSSQSSSLSSPLSLWALLSKKRMSKWMQQKLNFLQFAFFIFTKF